jgi:hypothetical protein
LFGLHIKNDFSGDPPPNRVDLFFAKSLTSSPPISIPLFDEIDHKSLNSDSLNFVIEDRGEPIGGFKGFAQAMGVVWTLIRIICPLVWSVFLVSSPPVSSVFFQCFLS